MCELKKLLVAIMVIVSSQLGAMQLEEQKDLVEPNR